MENKKIIWVMAATMLLTISCALQPAKAKKSDGQTNRSQIKESVDYKVKKANKGEDKTIEAWLAEGKSLKSSDNMVLFYARKFINYPYVAFTLDQDLEESLVVNTKGVDCTTYVEYVMALTICTRRNLTSFDDFCRVLSHVRYVDGKVAYTARQHYFTYWISDNIHEGLVANVTLPPSPLSKTRVPHVDYMTKHVESYKMLNAHRQWLPEIKKMENKVNNTSFTYIPKGQLKDSNKYRKYIKDGDIIGIVTNKAGLDISHVGFAVWHKDGLHLMNASSLHKKVVDEPMTLYQYLQKQTSSEGIRIVRIL